jgi:hypothetical protein
MENIGILQKPLTDGFVLVMELAVDAQMYDVLLVETQIYVSHIRELTGNHERSDDEKYRQSKLENDQRLSKQRIGPG